MIGTATDQTDLHYSLKKAKQNSPETNKREKINIGALNVEDVDQAGYSSDEETTSALAEFTDK